MRAVVALASCVVLASALASCAAPTPPSLEDSRGVRVEYQCSADGACEVTGSSEPPPACTALPDIDLFVIGAGSVALVCGASVVGRSLVLHDATCRPVLCRDESECPQWDDRHYACDDGWCRTSTRAPDLLDVTAACLAMVGRPSSCGGLETDPATMAAVETAMAACTETSCAIPTECLP